MDEKALEFMSWTADHLRESIGVRHVIALGGAVWMDWRALEQHLRNFARLRHISMYLAFSQLLKVCSVQSVTGEAKEGSGNLPVRPADPSCRERYRACVDWIGHRWVNDLGSVSWSDETVISLLRVLVATKCKALNEAARLEYRSWIRHTVRWEKRIYSEWIREGRIDTSSALKWFQDVCFAVRHFKVQHFEIDFTKERAFLWGIVELVRPSAYKQRFTAISFEPSRRELLLTVPVTFRLDEYLFIHIRFNLLREIAITTCMDVVEKYQLSDITRSSLDGALSALASTQRPSSTSMDEIWRGMVMALGAEISKARKFELSAVKEAVQQELSRNLNDPESYERAESLVADRLFLELSREYQKFQGVSDEGLFDMISIESERCIVTSEQNAERGYPRGYGGSRVKMVAQLALMAILHWRIWSPLVYDPDINF